MVNDRDHINEQGASVVSFTHEQNSICSQKQLNDTAHEHTIICKQLYPGHVVGSRPIKRKKHLLSAPPRMVGKKGVSDDFFFQRSPFTQFFSKVPKKVNPSDMIFQGESNKKKKITTKIKIEGADFSHL